MNLRIFILVCVMYIAIVPPSSSFASEETNERDVLNEEKREIIILLDMLENYELIDSMDIYNNMDEIKNLNIIEAGDEAGSKEVEP